jgi:hypothetical protein
VSVECPVCGIGRLERWRVIATNSQVLVCDECSSTWAADVTPTVETGSDVILFIEGLGLDSAVKQLRRDGE